VARDDTEHLWSRGVAVAVAKQRVRAKRGSDSRSLEAEADLIESNRPDQPAGRDNSAPSQAVGRPRLRFQGARLFIGQIAPIEPRTRQRHALLDDGAVDINAALERELGRQRELS
jgi:hypothetical protein